MYLIIALLEFIAISLIRRVTSIVASGSRATTRVPDFWF
jgi:hypothetical protein